MNIHLHRMACPMRKTLLDSLSGLAKIADIFNDFQDKFLCVSDKRIPEKVVNILYLISRSYP